MQKLVQRVVEQFNNWNADVRVKACQVLDRFIHYTEDQITGYCPSILPVSFKILAGDEPSVMDACLKMLSTLGFYVAPDSSLPLVLTNLSSNGGSFKVGCLRCMEAIVRGADRDKLAGILPRVVEAIADRELLQNENMLFLLDLAKCLYQVILKSNPSFKLFMMTVYLKSVEGHENIPGYTLMKEQVEASLFKLCEFEQMSRDDLYGLHLKAFLESLSGVDQWNKHDAEPRAFQDCVLGAKNSLAQHLPVLLPIWSQMAALEKDYEVRQRLHDTLLELFNKDAPSTLGEEHSLVLLQQVVFKNLVWRAGPKNTLVRGQATQLLAKLLALPNHLDLEALRKLFEDHLLPLVISNLDDDLVSTRQYNLEIIDHLLLLVSLWTGILI